MALNKAYDCTFQIVTYFALGWFHLYVFVSVFFLYLIAHIFRDELSWSLNTIWMVRMLSCCLHVSDVFRLFYCSDMPFVHMLNTVIECISASSNGVTLIKMETNLNIEWPQWHCRALLRVSNTYIFNGKTFTSDTQERRVYSQSYRLRQRKMLFKEKQRHAIYALFT